MGELASEKFGQREVFTSPAPWFYERPTTTLSEQLRRGAADNRIDERCEIAESTKHTGRYSSPSDSVRYQQRSKGIGFPRSRTESRQLLLYSDPDSS
ncbi:MAG: hypothetical protein MHM6MM_001217 [Cercozoa sp. M6MM]